MSVSVKISWGFSFEKENKNEREIKMCSLQVMKDEKLITFVYETLTQWCICLGSRELQNLVKWTFTLKLRNVPLEKIEVFKNFMTLHFSSFTSISSRTASSKLNVLNSLFILIITFFIFCMIVLFELYEYKYWSSIFAW